MFEILKLPFMQNAIVGGEILAIIAGMIGPFLVFRKMSFMSVGISHGAFAGIALGIFLSFSPLWTAVAFAIGLALLIGFTSRIGKVAEDATIGTLFSFSMALGIFLISISKGYHPDVMGYLFGDLLAISRTDVYFSLVVLGVVTVWLLCRGKAMAYSSFEEDFSRIIGVPVELDYYIFMAVTALVTVAAVKFVGVVLASSIMVAPSATAKILSNRFKRMMFLAVIFGMVAVFMGLIFSYEVDIACGPSVVFVVTAMFFCALIIKQIRHKRGQNRTKVV